MENIGKIISENVVAIRNKLNLTQAEAAELARIPFGTYRDVEYGKSKDPGASTLWAIAKAFNVSIGVLFGETRDSISQMFPIEIEESMKLLQKGMLRLQDENRRLRNASSIEVLSEPKVARFKEPDHTKLRDAAVTGATGHARIQPPVTEPEDGARTILFNLIARIPDANIPGLLKYVRSFDKAAVNNSKTRGRRTRGSRG